MKLPKIRIVLLMLAYFYFVLPSAIYSRGPIFPTAIFTYKRTPDFPLKDFVRGKLGVIHPGLKQSYLFVAYRYLSDQQLNEQEQAVLDRYWRSIQHPYMHPDAPDEAAEGQQSWFKARALVTSEQKEVNVYREFQRFYVYENCYSDAFRNAARTLHARIKQFGVKSAVMKNWVAAQDAVFANCSEVKTIPAAAATDDPAVIKADRAYQIAAAHLYSADYNKAEEAFRAIAMDKSSPWSGIAPYLQARAIIRRASVDFGEGYRLKDHAAEFERAETILNRVVDDPSLKRWHTMSRERIGLIEARLHPEKRLLELSMVLSRPRRGALLHQEIPDLIYLMERNEKVRSTDLTDWVNSMKDLSAKPRDKGAQLHALAMWQKKKTLPWLVAAMAADDGAGSVALLASADSIPTDSPAYLSAAGYSVRAKPNGRLARIDELLKLPDAELPSSARNRLLHEKFLSSESFDDFLSTVARVPAQEVMFEEDENAFEKVNATTDKSIARFDADSARAFNRQVPLQLLVRAAETKSLPEEVHEALANAAWTKAFLLNEVKAADEMTPVTMKTLRGSAAYLETYLKESDPEAKHFAGVYAILHFPGLRPVVDAGVGRETPIGKIDNYRDNWWCGKGKPDGQYGDFSAKEGLVRSAGLYEENDRYYGPAGGLPKLPTLKFLSKDESRVADVEWEKLSAMETAPNLLANSVLAHVKNAPTDARNPEALDLSLRALRYGCHDATYVDLSHKVFRVLHAKYPKSAAAKRNRPWG